jgi:hypothetical protein
VRRPRVRPPRLRSRAHPRHRARELAEISKAPRGVTNQFFSPPQRPPPSRPPFWPTHTGRTRTRADPPAPTGQACASKAGAGAASYPHAGCDAQVLGYSRPDRSMDLSTYAKKVTVSVLYWYEKLSGLTNRKSLEQAPKGANFFGRHGCDLPVVSPGAPPVGGVRKAVGLVWWVLCRRCVCGFRLCRGLVVVGCCGLWWLSSFGCASACSCVVVRCGWRLSACRRYEFHRHSFHHRQLLSHSLRTTFEVFAF